MKLLNELLNRPASALSLAHLSLACVGLMWVFPFLIYYHAYPLTTFYQEWSAAVLGLAAMLLLLVGRYWRQPEIPRIILLPIGFMLLAVLQFALGKMAYFGQMLLYTLYLMWAALLVMLGSRLREELGLPTLVTALAWFLLLGAELSAVIGIQQHFQFHALSLLDRVVTAKVFSGLAGNIAQPNHFANYIALGLASLGLLYARSVTRAGLAAAVAAALPLLFVLTLSGSRGSWFYLLWFAGAAFFLRRRDKMLRRVWYYSVSVLFGFGLMHWAVQLPWLSGSAGAAGSVTSVQRMLAEDVSSGSVRFYLWHEAWLIFTQFPLLGAGFGQYAWQHFLLAPSLHNTGISGLYNNAHNLVMQLAAETGLVGLLLLFGTLGLWLRQQRQAERSIYHWWGYAVLAVLALHSLLEYPLWYAYFIGIAALMLGMLDTSRYQLELSSVGRWFVLLTLLLAALTLQQLLGAYRSIETLTALRPQSGNSATYYERMRSGMAEVSGVVLLQPYARLYLSSMIEVGPERLADKLAQNGEVMHFVPISAVAYRQSLLLALSGDAAAAQTQMERAIWAYPGDFPATAEELCGLARKDAAHFAALLEFALQKYEEHQRAIHTK